MLQEHWKSCGFLQMGEADLAGDGDYVVQKLIDLLAMIPLFRSSK